MSTIIYTLEISANHAARSERKLANHAMGVDKNPGAPMSKNMLPIYIKISTSSEKRSVVIGAIYEIRPNLKTENGSVIAIAKKEERKDEVIAKRILHQRGI